MRKWNKEVMFPTDNCFKNRITGIKFAPSNQGNPMITIHMEVVSPTSYEIGGEEFDITGVETDSYFTTKVVPSNNASEEEVAHCAESTKECKKKAKELLHNLGIEIEEDAPEWDSLGPVIEVLRGKLVLTEMRSKIDERRKTPTSKQIAEAKKAGKRPEGDIMTHPITGKKLVDYWPQVVQIYGLVEGGGINAPY